jgi:hypothetical protein
MTESKATYRNLVHGIRSELQESILHLGDENLPAEERIVAAQPHLLQATEHVGRLISYLERVWSLVEEAPGRDGVPAERLEALLTRIHHRPDEGG